MKKMLNLIGEQIHFTYDFGDNWEVVAKLEKTSEISSLFRTLLQLNFSERDHWPQSLYTKQPFHRGINLDESFVEFVLNSRVPRNRIVRFVIILQSRQ